MGGEVSSVCKWLALFRSDNSVQVNPLYLFIFASVVLLTLMCTRSPCYLKKNINQYLRKWKKKNGQNCSWPCLHGSEGQFHCSRVAGIKEITGAICGLLLPNRLKQIPDTQFSARASEPMWWPLSVPVRLSPTEGHVWGRHSGRGLFAASHGFTPEPNTDGGRRLMKCKGCKSWQ